MTNAVTIKNLTKSYKDFSLKNIDLQIPKGSVFGLIGENGAGKSTLIKSMLGTIKSSYDTLEFFGNDFINHEREIKETIAVIFEQTHFDVDFTPYVIGKIMSKVYKSWNQNKYIDLIKKFNLPLDKKIKDFSRGMKMKLEFAISLSHDTKLIILDEATSGLDPVFRDDILEILREYSEDEEHTILMSSHITSDLDKIADYICFIHDGEIIFTRSYEDIRENYGIVKCGRNIFEALSEDDIVAYRKEEHFYSVLVNNKHGIKGNIDGLVVENASLEDIMLFTVKGEKV